MHTSRLLLLILPILFFSCGSGAENAVKESDGGVKNITIRTQTLPKGGGPNPGAEGFNLAGSDNMALNVADSIVKYHGGRAAWDEVRYLSWDFFGARTLTWDKHKSRVRIDVPKENAVYLLDYSGEKPAGRVRRLGDEVTDPEALAADLAKAQSMFNNDAFWLVHQFKLKDNGVTLKYIGEKLDPQAQRPSHIIDQTFAGVGDTPDNRYRLYVDKVTYRINTWQFFKNADDAEPSIETPWNDYLPHGKVMLSGDRGGRFQLGNISLKTKMNERVFTEF